MYDKATVKKSESGEEKSIRWGVFKQTEVEQDRRDHMKKRHQQHEKGEKI